MYYLSTARLLDLAPPAYCFSLTDTHYSDTYSDGWSLGRNITTSRIGIFPLNLVVNRRNGSIHPHLQSLLRTGQVEIPKTNAIDSEIKGHEYNANNMSSDLVSIDTSHSSSSTNTNNTNINSNNSEDITFASSFALQSLTTENPESKEFWIASFGPSTLMISFSDLVSLLSDYFDDLTTTTGKSILVEKLKKRLDPLDTGKVSAVAFRTVAKRGADMKKAFGVFVEGFDDGSNIRHSDSSINGSGFGMAESSEKKDIRQQTALAGAHADESTYRFPKREASISSLASTAVSNGLQISQHCSSYTRLTLNVLSSYSIRNPRQLQYLNQFFQLIQQC